jgi:hypothetical protein
MVSNFNSYISHTVVIMGCKFGSKGGNNLIPNYDEKTHCIQNVWLETYIYIYIYKQITWDTLAHLGA